MAYSKSFKATFFSILMNEIEFCRVEYFQHAHVSNEYDTGLFYGWFNGDTEIWFRRRFFFIAHTWQANVIQGHFKVRLTAIPWKNFSMLSRQFHFGECQRHQSINPAPSKGKILPGEMPPTPGGLGLIFYLKLYRQKYPGHIIESSRLPQLILNEYIHYNAATSLVD